MVRRTKNEQHTPEEELEHAASAAHEEVSEVDLPEADVVEEARRKRALTPEEQIIALQEECAQLREKSLRAQADYQNQKRRALVERDMEVRRKLQPLLDELLLVLDFLDMALSSPATQPETKNLAIGVDMTRSRFLQALENVGVTPITTEGMFDPSLHEATETVHAPDAQPGSILRTSRRGYEWNDIVLRHAQVVVAAGDEEASSDSAETGSADAPADNEPEA